MNIKIHLAVVGERVFWLSFIKLSSETSSKCFHARYIG